MPQIPEQFGQAPQPGKPIGGQSPPRGDLKLAREAAQSKKQQKAIKIMGEVCIRTWDKNPLNIAQQLGIIE